MFAHSIQVRAMLQYLHLAKVLNLADLSHIQKVNLVVQWLLQTAVNPADPLHHQPEAVSPAVADVTTLANQLNVITVR